MKSPFQPSAKRILLINFDGMSIYTLEGVRLVHVARFSAEDEGYENFQLYLSNNKKTPVTILVDSVSEDFVVESVAHTNAMDRPALLKRKTDQHFRGAEYRSARIVGRAVGGRKDDRVLFSALTKGKGVDPWVQVLLAEEVPIQSITSPAFALCKVAKHYNLMTSSSILLVNWEQSGIRQTLIEGDKVIFSRLTPLPTYQSVEPAELIIETCQQCEEYLERIGLVPFDLKLDVHIITPNLDSHDFAKFLGHRSFGLIEHHNSVDMIQINRFSGAQKEITAVLLCLDWGIRTGLLTNIYAPSPAMRFYHLKQARRFISALSIAMMILGIILSAPVLIGSYDRGRNINRISSEIAPLKQNYDELIAAFPATPIPSDAMALAVSTFNRIHNQVENPTEILIEIGRVMSRFPSISLSSIDWNLVPAEDSADFTDYVLANDLVLDVKLFGVLNSARDVQDSDARLKRLIESLEEIENVTVSIIEQAVETSTASEIITLLTDESTNAQFAISLIRRS
jgi:hypothetical protein